MRADRLLSILLILQIRGRVTSRQLAERLEVSERTIHRDMEALTAAGVPVYAERGSRGGWRLLADYRTDLTGLKPGEVQALLVGQPNRLLEDLGLSRASEGAWIKLLASLPALYRREAESVRGRIYIEPRGAAEPVPHLPTLLELLQEEVGHNSVRTCHSSGNSTTSSTFFRYPTPAVPPLPRLWPIIRSTVTR